jgi:argininosuccinate synthase
VEAGGPRSSGPARPLACARATLARLVDLGDTESPQRIASYQADPDSVGRVLLLYSGGLDTSVMLHWIQQRYGAEVVTLTIDLGQPGEDWDLVVAKARDLGALEALVVDAREEFAADYVLPAIKANALYGGGYPLFTALARPLIAKLAVQRAREAGCDTIAHGCTGKGNDQVRIDGTIAALDPELRVLAPVRDWRIGRKEEIAYAREHRIPVKGGTEEPPYSIDDNLWGRSSEGRSIEDLSEPTPEDVFGLVTPPHLAPDEAETVTVGFERGGPVSLDGERLGLVELIGRAAQIGARHGAGIVDHIEDRIVGLKVRDVYEVPAAAIILPAHRELEKLVSTIHQNNFKRALEDEWAYLCYSGLWYEPLRGDLDAYMEAANEYVTGEAVVRLYKGQATVVARSSPYELYDEALAGFAESGGSFSQQASPGFIELFTLQSRMAYRIRRRAGG